MRHNARFIWFVTLSVGIALATWAYGWWSVVALSAAWTFVRPTDAAVPALAALAGLSAWAALLEYQALLGPVARVADVVGSAMQVGAGPLVVLTLAFPALLAGATAGVVRGVSSGDVG